MPEDAKPTTSAVDSPLSGYLQQLADQLRETLTAGANPCVIFTQFAGSAYTRPESAEVASRALLDIFQAHPETLASCTRVVDLAAELAAGSSLLAQKVCSLWDSPKEEHKLTRLADELCNASERFRTQTAAAFTLELARRLSLSRPTYAARLIEHATNCEDQALAEVAKTWLKAGEFLRTQSEAVRFFWQNHMRKPEDGKDLKRMSARIALDAVRRAPVDAPICAVFRDSVPVEIWEAPSEPIAAPKVTEVSIAPTTMAPKIAATPIKAAAPQPKPAAAKQLITTRVSLRPAYRHSPEAAADLKPWYLSIWSHPSMAVVAVFALGGSLIWALSGSSKPDTDAAKAALLKIQVPVTPPMAEAQPFKPQATPPKLPAFKSPVRLVASSTPTPPVAEPKKPASIVSTKPIAPPVKPTPPTISIGSVETITVPPALSFSSLTFPHTSANRPHSPLRLPEATTASFRPPALVHSATPIASAPPAPTPPEEVIAKPMSLTDYDRWVMQQTFDLWQLYPELRDMQQAVVKGNWTSTIMKVGSSRHITDDHERYMAVLRWLVIDPPLGDDTRRIIFEKWATESEPEECIVLWEKMVELKSTALPDIAQAARQLLVHSPIQLTTHQQERLHRLTTAKP